MSVRAALRDEGWPRLAARYDMEFKRTQTREREREVTREETKKRCKTC